MTIGFLSILGIIFMISIINYLSFSNYNFYKEQNSSLNYALMKKTKLDLLRKIDQSLDGDINYGELCLGVNSNQFKNNTINFNEQKSLTGTYYSNGKTAVVLVDFANEKISILSSVPWHWSWYNLLGIGLDKIYQPAISEVVNE